MSHTEHSRYCSFCPLHQREQADTCKSNSAKCQIHRSFSVATYFICLYLTAVLKVGLHSSFLSSERFRYCEGALLRYLLSPQGWGARLLPLKCSLARWYGSLLQQLKDTAICPFFQCNCYGGNDIWETKRKMNGKRNISFNPERITKICSKTQVKDALIWKCPPIWS